MRFVLYGPKTERTLMVYMAFSKFEVEHMCNKSSLILIHREGGCQPKEMGSEQSILGMQPRLASSQSVHEESQT